MHHVTLLQILLLAAGALAASPLPCLWGLSQALGGPTLDALRAPSCTWVSLGHLQARLESRLQLYKEEGNELLKGLGRFCLDAAGTNPIPRLSQPRLSIVQSSLHVWGGGTPQLMSFKHPVSFSGVPPAAPLSRSPSPGEARRTGIPGQPSPPLPATATLLHPLPATRDVAKPSVGDPTLPGVGGDVGQSPANVGACPRRAAGRQQAAGRGRRGEQEAPAPEVTALFSDPGHIRWLPCLPWRLAPAAPSGCRWRAAPPLRFGFVWFFFTPEHVH